MIEKIAIRDKFNLFSEPWSPKIIAELNGQHVKLVRLAGEFEWHLHEHEDELFLVVDGVLRILFRDQELILAPASSASFPAASSTNRWPTKRCRPCFSNRPGPSTPETCEAAGRKIASSGSESPTSLLRRITGSACELHRYRNEPVSAV